MTVVKLVRFKTVFAVVSGFRVAAVLVVMALIAGMTLAAGPVPVSAKVGEQLSTCLNLATGVTRVLVREACDPVLEMTQGWDAISVDEPVGRSFSGKTLAQAVVLSTGGDTSRFTKKDWASLARLQATNQAAASQTTNVDPDSGEVVVIATTCVNDKTGVARVLVSGGCQGRTESPRRWVAVDPLQSPGIATGAPGLPKVEEVVVVGANSQAVTVQPPTNSGSSPIRSITVIAIPGGQRVTIGGGAGGTALFTGLSPGTKYTFVAVAVNDSGPGPRIPSQVPAPGPDSSAKPDPTPSPTPVVSASAAAAAGGGGTPVVAAVAPGAPTIGVATVGVAQVSVAFTAPASTGGAAITSYTVTSSPGGFTATGATSPIVVTGLTNGTAYTFTVTATNSAGTSAASAASASSTPRTVPGAPTVGVATAGVAQVSVAFTSPASTGGAAITSYTATSSPGSITGTVSQAGSGTITVSGLTAGTPYTFTVTATNSAGTSVASGASGSVTPAAYSLGDTGPGGGLVFLISGGLTYEMAPNTWSGSSSDDTPTLTWCSNMSSNITGAAGTAIATGSANTTAMQSPACTSGAGVSARAYRGGGFSDWFLPSQDELNAMCNYSRNPTTPPTGVCTGAQNGTFSTGAYGFASVNYWSSSQFAAFIAWYQWLDIGNQGNGNKNFMLLVRPVRAF